MMLRYCLPSVSVLWAARIACSLVRPLRRSDDARLNLMLQHVARRTFAAMGVWLDMFYLTLVTLSLKSTLCRPVGGEMVLFAESLYRP